MTSFSLSSKGTLRRLVLADRSRSGFTLIELLIVIAIILILIAIALPNFLEAQIRARVTKAKGEIRSLGIAMESYFLDWAIYPAEHERDQFDRPQQGLAWLTTPNAYIGSIPEDPFGGLTAESEGKTFVSYESGGIERAGPLVPFTKDCNAMCMVTWAIFSNGPDNIQGAPGFPFDGENAHNSRQQPIFTYAPTNGTKSGGDIRLWGGDGYWIGVDVPPPGSDQNELAYKGILTPDSFVIGLVLNGQRIIHRLPVE